MNGILLWVITTILGVTGAIVGAALAISKLFGSTLVSSYKERLTKVEVKQEEIEKQSAERHAELVALITQLHLKLSESYVTYDDLEKLENRMSKQHDDLKKVIEEHIFKVKE